MSGQIRVLHVDDEPDFADMAATYLKREDDRFVVETATSASEGLELLAERDYDCVVSDYDMPGTDGIGFLQTVREDYDALPFILFTGKGSEEVASDAMSADVTDYLRKGGTEKFELLANRVEKAVKEYEIQRFEEETKQNPFEIMNRVTDGFYALDDEWRLTYVNDAATDIFGKERTELLDERIWDIFPEAKETPFYDHYHETMEEQEPRTIEEYFGPWDRWYREHLYPSEEGLSVISRDVTERKKREVRRDTMRERMDLALARTDSVIFEVNLDTGKVTRYGEFENFFDHPSEEVPTREDYTDIVVHPDDEEKFRRFYDQLADGERNEGEIEYRTDPEIGGERWMRDSVYVEEDADDSSRLAVGLAQDITESKQRERELERRNERLEEFASLVSHDLRNPLRVAEGHLELARQDCESDHLEDVSRAHERIETLIDDILTVAREGDRVTEKEAVHLANVAERCWQNVGTEETTLVTGTEMTVRADESQLQRLLENLIQNSVEHSGCEVTVTVSDVEDGDGFYVADDGSGVPEDKRDEIFESGYSTAEEGTGFGLSIVERVAEAHGWEISVTESDEGGARFEITGIEFVDDPT